GGLAATNYLYGLAKSDGLTLGMFQAHRYMQQLTGAEEVKFDLRKFNWIGTMEKTEVMFSVRADAAYKSFDDVLSRVSLRDVAPLAPPRVLTYWQRSLRRDFEPDLIWWSAIKAAMPSTSPWKRARLFAAA